jgi:hypothetical protein
VQAYAVTLALFFAGWRLGAFSPARVYELFGEILSALNLFSLAFCGFLYAKARPCCTARPHARAHPGQPSVCCLLHTHTQHASRAWICRLARPCEAVLMCLALAVIFL